jgi:hypothetical protein
MSSEGTALAQSLISRGEEGQLVTTPRIFFVPGATLSVSPWANHNWDNGGRMKGLVVEGTVRLTKYEVIVILLTVLLIWFSGYTTGAEVTRILEKTRVIYDCIFIPAPENSSRV